MQSRNKNTVTSYTYDDTSDPNIKRFCDRNGDWTHYWLVKEKRFVKAVNWILALGYNKGPRFAAYLSRTTEEEARMKLLKAGDEGSRTHRAISDLIDGSRISMTTKYPSDIKGGRQEPLNDEEWDNLEAFENWCIKYKPKIVAQDQTVASTNYAGTFDALVVITPPEGDKTFARQFWGQEVLILVDWKSSSGIWEEYKAQLAAYWMAIHKGKKYDKFIKAYPTRMFTGIVRLGTRHNSGFEFKVWTQEETETTNIYEFYAAQTIADAHEPEFEPEVRQIKTSFFIKVPKAVVGRPKRAKKIKKVKDEESTT
jgi:hypothetical protein